MVCCLQGNHPFPGCLNGAKWISHPSTVHHLKQPWNDDSLVNTNQQWFPMVAKWCRILSTVWASQTPRKKTKSASPKSKSPTSPNSKSPKSKSPTSPKSKSPKSKSLYPLSQNPLPPKSKSPTNQYPLVLAIPQNPRRTAPRRPPVPLRQSLRAYGAPRARDLGEGGGEPQPVRRAERVGVYRLLGFGGGHWFRKPSDCGESDIRRVY